MMTRPAAGGGLQPRGGGAAGFRSAAGPDFAIVGAHDVKVGAHGGNVVAVDAGD
jgi:hypothetical protein